MNITLTLEPEVEKGLVARANEFGLTLDAYLENFIRREAGINSGPRLRGKEKAQAFVKWAESHRPTRLLSDDDISRETMYPDRA